MWFKDTQKSVYLLFAMRFSSLRKSCRMYVRDAFIPVCVVAISASCVFYGGIAGGVELIAGICAAGGLILRFFTKRTAIFVCVITGACIGIFSYSAMRTEQLRQTSPLITLISSEKVRCITGTVVSSPSVMQNGRLYRFAVSVAEVASTSMRGNAKGTVDVIAHAVVIEKMYPGKLFSGAKTHTVVIVESGALIKIYGTFSNNDEISTSDGGSDCAFRSRCFFADSMQNVLDEHNAPRWKSPLLKARAMLRLYIKRIVYSWSLAGGFLLALISGSREYMHYEVSSQFKDAGLAHILALSGMHVSIFGCMAFAVGNALGGKKAGSLCMLGMCTLFYWFAGYSPSLLRALLFVWIVSLGRFASIRLKMAPVLALAFLVQLVAKPSDAAELSFMLSYSAMAGLVFSDSVLLPLFAKVMPHKIARLFASSSGAQLCTAPVTFFFFKTVSFTGIFSSIVVCPLVTLFFIFGIFAILVCVAVPSATPLVGMGLSFLYRIICFSVRIFSHFVPIDFS